MKVAFQMDPLGPVDIAADSTFRLAEEAQARGHELYYYTPDKLAYDRGRVVARGHSLTVQRVQGDHSHLGAEEVLDLSAMDVIWLRQDPPFDMFYITTTHLLERLRETTLVLNDPFWVRNFPEKLMILDFPDLMPETTITRDLATIKAFKNTFGDVIVKPLYGNGGAGVFLLRKEDSNLSSLYEMFTGFSREPLIVQQFLPEIRSGDKRVILVDGEPVGAINRMPAAGETRSNMHVGGRPEPSVMTERDHEICATIGPKLREHGQVFVGIDVIGSYLTEINVTSPTGIQELERFDGINVAQKIWEVTEARCR
ncbi:MAG: glutathione synthase [Pseudomonadota bacterium]